MIGSDENFSSSDKTTIMEILILFLFIVVAVLIYRLISVESKLIDAEFSLKEKEDSLEETERKFKAHKFYHRFKTVPTKKLKMWLDSTKVENEDDEIMIEQIEKIVAGRNNR